VAGDRWRQAGAGGYRQEAVVEGEETGLVMNALSGFLKRVKGDYRIGPLHVSLYVVLLEICKSGKRPGLFAVRREEVMAKAKICSMGTYYKVMRELMEWGYVVYRRGYGQGKKSMVGIVG
jgi:hypothetical protein